MARVDRGLQGVFEYLLDTDRTLGRFYLLPKSHKGLDSVKGRPVMSNMVCFTENISTVLDYHINPLVSQWEIFHYGY